MRCIDSFSSMNESLEAEIKTLKDENFVITRKI